MASPIKLLVELYYSPIASRIMKAAFFSRSLPAWPLLYGFWVFYLVERSICACYLSRVHRTAVALLMCLVNDGVFYFFPPGDLTVRVPASERLMRYLGFTACAALVAAALLLLFAQLRSRAATAAVRSLTPAALACGALCQTRLFKYIVQALSGVDERLTLIVALAAVLWVQGIDYVTRRITCRRNQIPATHPTTIIALLVECALAFAITRNSSVSAMLMFKLPFNFALFFLLVAVFATYSVAYLRALTRRKSKIN